MRDFKERRGRQFIATAVILVAVVPLLLINQAGPQGMLGIRTPVVAVLCLAVIFGVAVFSLFNWRCPACNAYLGRGINPKSCPKCGARLQ